MTDLRSALFAGRRPELYKPIIEKTLAGRNTPDDVRNKMDSPRTD